MLDSELIDAARKAGANAYAPYSKYHVGAAVRDERGQIFVGCNVENISYGGTICAERHAIGAMVVGGGRRIAELVVATVDGGSPCGICLQSIAEFAGSDLTIVLVDQAGEGKPYHLGDLLQRPFQSNAVARDRD